MGSVRNKYARDVLYGIKDYPHKVPPNGRICVFPDRDYNTRLEGLILFQFRHLKNISDADEMFHGLARAPYP